MAMFTARVAATLLLLPWLYYLLKTALSVRSNVSVDEVFVGLRPQGTTSYRAHPIVNNLYETRM